MQSSFDRAKHDAELKLMKSPLYSKSATSEIKSKYEEYKKHKAEAEKQKSVFVYDPEAWNEWMYMVAQGSMYRFRYANQNNVSSMTMAKHSKTPIGIAFAETHRRKGDSDRIFYMSRVQSIYDLDKGENAMIGYLIMIIIGLLIIVGTNRLFKPTDYTKWKEADGIVEAVNTEAWDDGELRPSLPHIIVTFEIDGKMVRGRSNCIGTEKTIKQVIAKYPKGAQVHFRYNDSKETLVSQIANDLNFNKNIHIDDKEFPCDSIDKKAKLMLYGFGLAFMLIGITGIITI